MIRVVFYIVDTTLMPFISTAHAQDDSQESIIAGELTSQGIQTTEITIEGELIPTDIPISSNTTTTPTPTTYTTNNTL